MNARILELNKRLRVFYENDGKKYGPNLTTMEELIRRFEIVVDLRLNNIKQLFQILQSSQNVDLCFLLNTSCHIDGVKDSIQKIVDQLKNEKYSQNVQNLRLSLVTYQNEDQNSADQFEVLRFTNSIKEFCEFCEKIEKECEKENVIAVEKEEKEKKGKKRKKNKKNKKKDKPTSNYIKSNSLNDYSFIINLEKSLLTLNWDYLNSGTRLIFHISDTKDSSFSPEHDTQNLQNSKDSSPYSNSFFNLFAQLSKLDIQYFFEKSDDSKNLDVSKNLTTSILTSVRDSIFRSETTILSENDGASNFKTPKFFEFTEKEPAWEHLEILKGSEIAFKFPESIRKLIDDVPLEKMDLKQVEVKMAENPFKKDPSFVYFYGQSLSSNPPSPLIFKEYLHNFQGNIVKRFELEAQTQIFAAYLCERFCCLMKEKKLIDVVPMEFLESKIVAIKKGLAIRYLACERRFLNEEKFVQFTNNLGYKIGEDKMKAMGISEELVDLVMAFSHWTYKVTGSELMVVNLQGFLSQINSNPFIFLTSPSIHCVNLTRFGHTNLGREGMKRFFVTHKCNQFCKALKLK